MLRIAPSRMALMAFVVIAIAAATASCSKTSVSTAPKPKTQTDADGRPVVNAIINPGHIFPMNDYFSTLSTNPDSPSFCTKDSVNFWYPGTHDYTAAEMGYCFRSKAKGEVVSLGINLPGSGYWHLVTLWDSVTTEALGSVQILSVGSTWIYSDLNNPVAIKANHGYLVTVNTAVGGIKINQDTPAEAVWNMNGIWVWGQSYMLPFFPATDGPITIENSVWFPYGIDHIHPLPFPGSGIGSMGFQGFCDVGFNRD